MVAGMLFSVVAFLIAGFLQIRIDVSLHWVYLILAPVFIRVFSIKLGIKLG